MASHSDIDLKIIVGASGLLEKYGRVVDVIRADGLNVTRKFSWFWTVMAQWLTQLLKGTCGDVVCTFYD